MEAPNLRTNRIGANSLVLTDLNLLRRLRASIQDLRSMLEHVRKGEALLATYATYITQTVTTIDGIFAQIPVDVRDDEEQGVPGADLRQHLNNVWQQMKACPVMCDPTRIFSSQEQLQHLRLLADQSQEIILRIGAATIPPRLTEWLKTAKPGYYIPFHAVFDDELPSYEDRVKVLNYIAFAPKTIEGGIVDPTNGLIYRYSESLLNQVLTFVGVVACLTLLTGLVAVSPLLPISGWPIAIGDQGKLLACWGAILIGVVLHNAVAAAKQMQARPGLPPVIAAGDILQLVNAQVGRIVLKLLLALFGLFGLVFGAGVGTITVFNAFLVGYSLDSFVELFSGTIEQRAATQALALKRQLGVETG